MQIKAMEPEAREKIFLPDIYLFQGGGGGTHGPTSESDLFSTFLIAKWTKISPLTSHSDCCLAC